MQNFRMQHFGETGYIIFWNIYLVSFECLKWPVSCADHYVKGYAANSLSYSRKWELYINIFLDEFSWFIAPIDLNGSPL